VRFVSISAKFAVGIIDEKSHPTPYGAVITDRPGYTAHFTQDDVSDEDLEFVRREWGDKLPGQTVLVDEVTPAPLLQRVSVFDTEEASIREGWSGRTIMDDRGDVHDFKTFVEAKLSERAERHPDFRQLVEAPVEPPWPNYFSFGGSLEQLIETLVRMGHDLHKVLRFEQQQGRVEVAAAIQAQIDREQAAHQDAVQVPA